MRIVSTVVVLLFLIEILTVLSSGEDRCSITDGSRDSNELTKAVSSFVYAHAKSPGSFKSQLEKGCRRKCTNKRCVSWSTLCTNPIRNLRACIKSPKCRSNSWKAALRSVGFDRKYRKCRNENLKCTNLECVVHALFHRCSNEKYKNCIVGKIKPCHTRGARNGNILTAAAYYTCKFTNGCKLSHKQKHKKGTCMLMKKNKKFQKLHNKIMRYFKTAERPKCLQAKLVNGCKPKKSPHCSNFFDDNFQCYVNGKKGCKTRKIRKNLMRYGFDRRFKECKRKKKCSLVQCVIYGLFSSCFSSKSKRSCIVGHISANDIKNADRANMVTAAAYFICKYTPGCLKQLTELRYTTYSEQDLPPFPSTERPVPAGQTLLRLTLPPFPCYYQYEKPIPELEIFNPGFFENINYDDHVCLCEHWWPVKHEQLVFSHGTGVQSWREIGKIKQPYYTTAKMPKVCPSKADNIVGCESFDHNVCFTYLWVGINTPDRLSSDRDNAILKCTLGSSVAPDAKPKYPVLVHRVVIYEDMHEHCQISDLLNYINSNFELYREGSQFFWQIPIYDSTKFTRFCDIKMEGVGTRAEVWFKCIESLTDPLLLSVRAEMYQQAISRGDPPALAAGRVYRLYDQPWNKLLIQGAAHIPDHDKPLCVYENNGILTVMEETFCWLNHMEQTCNDNVPSDPNNPEHICTFRIDPGRVADPPPHYRNRTRVITCSRQTKDLRPPTKYRPNLAATVYDFRMYHTVEGSMKKFWDPDATILCAGQNRATVAHRFNEETFDQRRSYSDIIFRLAFDEVEIMRKFCPKIWENTILTDHPRAPVRQWFEWYGIDKIIYELDVICKDYDDVYNAYPELIIG